MRCVLPTSPSDTGEPPRLMYQDCFAVFEGSVTSQQKRTGSVLYMWHSHLSIMQTQLATDLIKR